MEINPIKMEIEQYQRDLNVYLERISELENDRFSYIKKLIKKSRKKFEKLIYKKLKIKR